MHEYLDVFNFFVALVVVSMAYIEYRTTRDRMFIFVASAFAFFAVGHMIELLLEAGMMPDSPLLIVTRLLGYLAVIYGLYSESKIYKVIR